MRFELVRKGKSRCFVFEKEHIKIVEETIKELDEFEFDYMPEDWVCYWDYQSDKYGTKLSLEYNGKFDIDVIMLKIACAKKGIAISIESTNYENDYCY